MKNESTPYQVKACCGCGVVRLSFGPVSLRLSRDEFSSLVGVFNEVQVEMQKSPAQSGGCSSEEVSLAMEQHLANRKFIA